MKTKFNFALAAILVGGAMFTSCNSDDVTLSTEVTELSEASIPASATSYVATNFPGASAKWSVQDSLYLAKFKFNGDSTQVAFSSHGDYRYTGKEYYASLLPEAIKTYLAEYYDGYYVDYAEFITTHLGEQYYKVVLKGHNLPQEKLYINEDATVVKHYIDNPEKNKDEAPTAAVNWMNENYPGVKVDWDEEDGYYRAEFTYMGKDMNAWFDANGNWLRTETDCEKSDLPTAVLQSVASNYPGYEIDDVQKVETAAGLTYYKMELKKKHADNVTVRVKPDGTFVDKDGNTVTPPTVNNDDNGTTTNANGVPQAAIDWVNNKYPNATVTWEKKDNKFIAKLKVDGNDAHVKFTADGTWTETKIEWETALPTAVQDYITANYPRYTADDVEYYETPSSTYFVVKLELKHAEDITLTITPEGKVISVE